MKFPKLKKIDLLKLKYNEKKDKYFHPDLRVNKKYLIAWNGEFISGSFENRNQKYQGVLKNGNISSQDEWFNIFELEGLWEIVE